MNSAHAIPFTYSESQLSSCATSFINANAKGNRNDCRDLFLQHASHYNRPRLTPDEETFWNSFITSETPRNVSGSSSRIEAFLNSVQFVHRHNTREGPNNIHTVGLNRFSDLNRYELPLSSSSTTHRNNNNNHTNELLGLFGEENEVFVTLDSDELIMELGRRFRKNDPSQKQQQPLTSSSIWSILLKHLSFGIFDSWWWIGERHSTSSSSSSASIEEHSKHSKSHKHKAKKYAHSNSFIVDKDNEMDGIESNKIDDDRDEWDTYLNWSTEDNPDGVGIVHDAMDQGLCGSCWAISALGSMEASIVRNMAYMAYEETYKHTSNYHSKSDLRAISVSTAQTIETHSLQTAELSAQELVDCDTRYDQGCAGGNPLLAFYFLHRFGVTSSTKYPYTGKQQTCMYHKVDKPIATVETWGILTPDHENNMEKVLRYIGPVAVGLVGADPSFLAYTGGVFSVKGGKCDLGEADHAMLIVGYGEEDNKDGTKTKYWIARNSWGTGWGENGYIRIERIGGRKGERGICEIARSPSVALGGMFTKDVQFSFDDRDYHGGRGSLGKNYRTSPNFKTESSQIGSILHRIRARLGFAEKGIGISMLDGKEDGTNSNQAYPLSQALALMSLISLLTYVYRKHRRISRNRASRERGEELASSPNNLSTVCLCSGSSVEYHDGNNAGVGEDTALLNNCTGRVAYS